MKQLRLSALTILMLAITLTAAAEPKSTKAQSDKAVSSRGLVDLSNKFIDKGVWSVGGTISYSTHHNDNYQIMIIDGINSSGYSFSVSPMVTYTYAKNQAVGARFIYDRSLLKIENATLTFGDEQTGTNLSVTDFYSLSHGYSMQALLRQYIPIGNTKRFALFNEIQLGVGGSQSKFAHDFPVTGTYARSHDYSLGLAPGVAVFVEEGILLEISVGVLGLSYKNTEQVHNQVYVGGVQSKAMNFKVNIFSIGFGIGFNI